MINFSVRAKLKMVYSKISLTWSSLAILQDMNCNLPLDQCENLEPYGK